MRNPLHVVEDARFTNFCGQFREPPDRVCAHFSEDRTVACVVTLQTHLTRCRSLVRTFHVKHFLHRLSCILSRFAPSKLHFLSWPHELHQTMTTTNQENAIRGPLAHRWMPTRPTSRRDSKRLSRPQRCNRAPPRNRRANLPEATWFKNPTRTPHRNLLRGVFLTWHSKRTPRVHRPTCSRGS